MGTALCLYPAETSLRKQYERRTTSQERQKHRTDGIAVSGREQAIEVRVRKEGSRRRAGAAIQELKQQVEYLVNDLKAFQDYDYGNKGLRHAVKHELYM
ncbi:MAG: hypothetical protein M1840_001986 [Geoglossum simile]|nr:MAG: hypothetical protein M1840_001986 [Geoglossum simile]